MGFAHAIAACALLLATCIVAGTDAHAAERASVDGPRDTLSLDKGWRFHPGDIPFPKMEGHEMTYSSAKAGKAWGAAAPEHDDSTWRELDLPHDWVVEGGGRLAFKRVLGRAEVWVDSVQLGRKSGFDADEFSVALAPGEGERELTVRVQSRPGEASGFGDVVVVESKAGAP